MTPLSALLVPAHVRLCLSARCPLSTEEVAGIAPSPQGALLRGRRDYAGCRSPRVSFLFYFSIKYAKLSIFARGVAVLAPCPLPTPASLDSAEERQGKG